MLTSSLKRHVQFALVEKLGMLRLGRLQFYRHIFPEFRVGPEVNVSEGSATEFFPRVKFEIVSDGYFVVVGFFVGENTSAAARLIVIDHFCLLLYFLQNN